MQRDKNIIENQGIPNFLIIGAQRAGTSSLNQYLNFHPNIQNALFKEVNFFSSNKNYNKGTHWYKKQFPNVLADKIFFEATPEYLYYPFVPERIYKYNPDIKIITILREPVKRAHSSWNKLKKTYIEKKEEVIKKYFSLSNKDIRKAMTAFLNAPQYKSFEECISEEINKIDNPSSVIEPSFVRRGIYYKQIERYLNIFPKRNILIIEFEYLKKNKINELNRVLNFLGVAPFKWESCEFKILNKGKYDSEIDPNTETLLKNFYKPYNEKLFELINKEYSW